MATKFKKKINFIYVILNDLYIDDFYFEKLTASNAFKFSKSFKDEDIIYEDDNLLVVNKPSGIAVIDEDFKNYDTLINRRKKYYYDKNIKTKPLINGIGYKELYNYFDGLCSKEEAVEKIKQNSRHYAKRQYTFLNHQLNVVWFETDYNNFNNTIEKVERK